MKILVLNSGSSSVKYQMFNAADEQVMAEGIVGKIGDAGAYLEHKAKGEKIRRDVIAMNHKEAFQVVIDVLVDKNVGVLGAVSEISAVGHRVVHGGDKFFASTVITDEVIDKIEECVSLSPLHNPPNLLVIKEAKKLLPGVPQVAVFDTAFHHAMPEKAYMYALPYEYYRDYKIRRYGFHGISHRYVSVRAAEIVQRPIEELKIITCHLGNGSSMAALDKGVSIDTSLGFTPLEGLIMGTRCGDLDPAITFFLSREVGLSIDEIDNLMNKKSGLLGISGVSNDVREITFQAHSGNKRCQLALEMCAYRIKKYIGAYITVLSSLDALVFTAGIGEKSPEMRSMVCKDMGALGIELDEKKNAEVMGIESIISSAESKVKVMVVPTNEEKIIAIDTLKLAEEEISRSEKGRT
ncbi:MAG: acetate kinase [Dehalococcoidia bacterium]|nr:acetate kinase [Dehalococcoidia bacterium]